MRTLAQFSLSCLVCCLIASSAFAQRGGGMRGGGFSHGGFRSGGFAHGGFNHGRFGGGGFNGGGFVSGGFGRGGFGGHGFVGGGFAGPRFFNHGFFPQRGFFPNHGLFPRFHGFSSPLIFGSFGFGYPYVDPFYWPSYTYPYYPAPYYSYPDYSYPVEPAAPVVIYQNYGPSPPPARASIREYPDNPVPPLYLIALRDGSIRVANAYWVEGNTLHYVTEQHERKQVSLDEVDRRFSERLNRERRVDFRLPLEP